MSLARLRGSAIRASRGIGMLSRPFIGTSRPTRTLGLSWRAQQATLTSQAGLSKEDINTRVLDVMKSFEKVDPTKLQSTARFKEDLGLDSLDAVEVVMAIEEEFAIEIPDEEADEIATVQQAIDYIAKTPEAH